MTWFNVSVTWDEDNEYVFAVQAQDEEHARLIALANAPEPVATVNERLDWAEDEVEEDGFNFDRVIPLEERS